MTNAHLDGHSPAVLHLTSHPEPGGIRLQLAGELDLATAQHLTDTCQALPLPAGGLLRLDLHNLTFLDAAGLRALLHTHRHAAAHGTRVQLHRPRPLARRILALTGLLTVLDIDGDHNLDGGEVLSAQPDKS